MDDNRELTELYALLLTGAGHRVRAFNHRAEALAALTEEGKRPDLLITDYLGLSMPVDRFMLACRAVYPGLRILMASGCNRARAGYARARPDRFIAKPFTPHDFLRAVGAALAA